MPTYITMVTNKCSHTVKPVYKGHSREHKENVAFMSSCSLYTG